jgi:cell division septum initiation protein DivIVA
MASLPPQDPSTPGSVAGAGFPIVRRGFDPEAVRDFLREVSQELSRLQHERDRLARELDDARAAARRQAPEDLDEATVAAKLGEEAARVLATAHEAAMQIRARTEETAARTLREADDDAARMRGDAEVEAARRRRETEEQCDLELEAARTEGREMVAEARALRERMLTDLTRRRDLAMQQIESMHIGRQRIMDVFRGARRDLDFILEELEGQAPLEEPDDELPPIGLTETGPMAATPGPEALVGVLIEEVTPAATESPESEDSDDDEGSGGSGPVAYDVEAEEADEAEDASPVEDEHNSVDDLFARLRASGAESVAQAVLEEPGSGTTSGTTRPTEATADPITEPSEVVDGGASAVAEREAALRPVRVALARSLKRVLADEQNEVLDRLRQRNASTAVDAVLGPEGRYGGNYREAAEDQVWLAARAGAKSLSDLDGEELHAALEARAVLDRCLETLNGELVVPLRARLTESLDAAGEDPAEAASRLRSTYREWKGRIDEISDDLARTAFGRAAYAVIAPGTPVCWVIDPAGGDCADAEDNALAGRVPAGEPFPTGHRYAPAYRGCRCLLVPDPG